MQLWISHLIEVPHFWGVKTKTKYILMKKLSLTLMLAAMATWASAQCTADFSYASSDPTFSFTDLSSVPPGSYYYWNFGDGGTSTMQNPTYTYNTNGAYAVCLTVSDSVCTVTYCDSVYVTTAPGGGGGGYIDSTYLDSLINCVFCDSLGGMITGCTADFYMFPDSTMANLWYFIDYSSTATDYLWDFGDGSTSTSQYPSHTYAASGTYTVCLTITNGTCSDTYCQTISFVADDNNDRMATFGDTPTHPFKLEGMYPNPVVNATTLTIQSDEDKLVQVTVVAMNGQTVYNESISVTEGQNSVQLDLGLLNEGNYVLTIVSGTDYGIAPFIKVR